MAVLEIYRGQYWRLATTTGEAWAQLWCADAGCAELVAKTEPGVPVAILEHCVSWATTQTLRVDEGQGHTWSESRAGALPSPPLPSPGSPSASR